MRNEKEKNSVRYFVVRGYGGRFIHISLACYHNDNFDLSSIFLRHSNKT